MAKVEKFLLHNFDTPVGKTISTDLPEGSVPLKISIFPDGIYLWAETPSIEVSKSESLSFYNLGKDEIIPEDCTYFTTLELFEEVVNPETGQAGTSVAVFHLYRMK